jgi:hypothetical protein
MQERRPLSKFSMVSNAMSLKGECYKHFNLNLNDYCAALTPGSSRSYRSQASNQRSSELASQLRYHNNMPIWN